MIYRVFILLILLCLSRTGLANAWYAQLETSLKQSLSSQIVNMARKMGLDDYRYSIDLNFLDSRLNLEPCQVPLNIETPQPLELGRSHIKVACKDTSPWALNVPTDIHLFADVVILNQPVSKDQVITESQLNLQRQDLADLRNGYYLKMEQVIGKQSKRALAGQTVLNSYLILPALMIHKGDKVMIIASKGAMSVKMPGEALSDGRQGRQIRVKNSRSERIIRATVVGPGEVLVQF